MNWKRTVLISVFLLIIAAAITVWIFSTEPTAVREGATRETAMLVEVTPAERGTYTPVIRGMGIVEAARDIMLSPRVEGEITWMSPAFTPGGNVRKGEKLLQIDPADYENILEARKSDLDQARADLAIEMGQQDVARKDYRLFDDTLSEDRKALVLREPQLNVAEANVKAAMTAVKQAQLDLQRTSVRAPFHAHILTRNVNLGSQVSPGENLGRIVGIDEYWVTVTVPLSHLQWLSFSNGNRNEASLARIYNRAAWGDESYREGTLMQLIGALEGQTRMARILVSVKDPLARSKANAHLPPLMIGSFVEVNLMAKELTNVFRLNRDYLRQNDAVWIMKDGKLDIRDVEIQFQDAEYAYITEGIHDGEEVVITNLSTVTEGVGLRTEGDESSSMHKRESGQPSGTQE